MHFIVTSVFWVIVFKTADRSHGDYDIWYFVFAHGVTLCALIIDAFLGKVKFNMYIIPI